MGVHFTHFPCKMRIKPIVLLVSVVSGDYCHKSVKHPELRNNLPINDLKPQFIADSTDYQEQEDGAPVSGYATRYSAGEGSDKFHVLHLWGGAYEMGFHHGRLMKNEVRGFINELWDYLVAGFGEKALILATQAIIDKTRKYVNPGYFEEIRGLADGAGLEYDKVNRIHAIGEL